MLKFINFLFCKFIHKLNPVVSKNSFLHPTSKLEPGTSFYNSYMDKHSFCGYSCEIYYAQIGKFVSISNNVIVGGGQHPMHWVGMSPVFYDGRDSVKAKFSKHKRDNPLNTVIHHDVWVGNSAIILSGVTVGTGSVIGAGAVVTKDVLPYSVVVGNPAKHIRFRFDDLTINKLLASEWWDFPDSRLSTFANNFNDIDAFLNNIYDE
jgi:acetyltransferase-like isoleucine patch superfamily enzyme